MSMDRDEIIETAARAMCRNIGWDQIGKAGRAEALREAEAGCRGRGRTPRE